MQLKSQGSTLIKRAERVSCKAKTGFTLVEVLVAIVIMALIAVVTGQIFHSATRSSESTEAALKRLAAVDRIWVLLENDVRNAIPQTVLPIYGDPIPAVFVEESDDYWLTIMRAGLANPLHQPRTEIVRVGYRLEDGAVWRDTWYDPRKTDQEDTLQRKIMEGVEDLIIRVLPPPPTASSLAAGPWYMRWPNPNAGAVSPATLPLAIEITIEHEEFGEIKRLFSFIAGIDNRSTGTVELPEGSSSGSSGGGSRGSGNNSGNPSAQGGVKQNSG